MMIYDVYAILICFNFNTYTARKNRDSSIDFQSRSSGMYLNLRLLAVNGNNMKELTLCEPLLHGRFGTLLAPRLLVLIHSSFPSALQ